MRRQKIELILIFQEISSISQNSNQMNVQNMKSKICLLLVILLNLSEGLYSAATTSSGNETDHVSLLNFKNQISDDPNGILNSWNDSQNHCQWFGVICNSQHQRVVQLNLYGQSLLGSISPYIGNLSFLKMMNLGSNRFSGEIPQEIGRLRRLRYLFLTNNSLGGVIPVSLSNCLEMRTLHLVRNRLVGQIPSQLGSLTKLEGFFLGYNNLTGEFPRFIGNLTSITKIFVGYNNLEGQLPEELGKLTSLFSIGVGSNSFSGLFPESLYNISSLAGISANDNSLEGNIPDDIGFTLPNLQEFMIGGNRFWGSIPVSLANASKITRLDLVANNFTGRVPNNLGNLPNLQWLNVAGNLLGTNSRDLDFISSLSNCSKLQSLLLSKNNFEDKLPNSIGNLSVNLQQLDLALNQISGEVPKGLENLFNLYLLGMDHNLFSGSIPSFFGRFKVQKLFLNNNKFSNRIPATLFNNTSLYGLYLSENKLEGDIPLGIMNCQSLHELYISQNNLNGTLALEIFSLPSLSILEISQNFISGSLPIEIGNLKSIYRLDISDNKFSGEIPTTIGQCINLEYVYMQGNFFQGTIPQHMASLKGIRVLDISRNNLTGKIPKDLEQLHFLQFLNLSFNNLEGEVPTKGVFSNGSLISLAGNPKLCGVSSCSPVTKTRSKKEVWIITIPIVGTVLILMALLVCFWIRRKNRTKSSASSFRGESFFSSGISYHQLHKATDGFSTKNLIGSGSFGGVYKGKLDNSHDLIAVKVMDLQKHGASKSFVAECTALRNVRHRNLIRVINCCSGFNFQGQEFKALVYEYMSNGDLENWLHNNNNNNDKRSLNLFERLKIACDVAFALEYLHYHCETPIVHRDLKPSNVLVDQEFNARVGDFGLARLLQQSYNSQLSTSGIIKGTIGYAAPGTQKNSSIIYVYTSLIKFLWDIHFLYDFAIPSTRIYSISWPKRLGSSCNIFCNILSNIPNLAYFINKIYK